MRWLEDVLLLEFITLRRVVVVAAFWFTLYQANPAWQLLLIGIAYLLPAAVIAWAQRRLKVDLTLDASFSPEPPSPWPFSFRRTSESPRVKARPFKSCLW